MRAHKLIEHPSDVGIEAHGQALAEAFEEAADGMMEIIAERSAVQSDVERTIELAADDIEQLLVKWLSELLYLYDGEHFLPSVIRIDELTETRLRATIAGEMFDAARHVPLLDIKAVTYHQLNVDRERHIVRVFLDV
ncbi:MAG TPA: archease [Bacteroidota bacterium]|nr:archease [Bacteroidota bacterium]